MPHPFAMPQDVLDRVARRRGQFRALDRADPRKTALVVVDMQNAFMMPGLRFLTQAIPTTFPFQDADRYYSCCRSLENVVFSFFGGFVGAVLDPAPWRSSSTAPLPLRPGRATI